MLKDPAVRFALWVYCPLRIALSGLAALVRGLYAGDLAPHPVFRPYLGVAPVEGGWREMLMGVRQRWDTLWYMLIARDGYSMQDTRIFAPPLYPWLMRAAGWLLGGTNAAHLWTGTNTAHLLGGLIISNLACIALFVYLYRLVEMEWDVVRARRSVVYLAIFPTAFFLFAAYAESLFMLCVVAAFYHARRGEWPVAGVWAFFAPLARLPGVAILAPLGWEYARQWWVSRRTEHPVDWWRGWPLVLPAAGGLLFPLYAYWVVGSSSLLAPFAIHTQRFMGRFAWPWESLWTAVRVLASGRFRVVEPFDLFFVALFLFLTVYAFRKLPAMYALYMAVTLAGTLTKVSAVQPLLSGSRYVLVLFPGFVVLAKWGWQNAWVHRLIVYLSAALLIFFAGQFAIWGWVG